MDWTRFRKNETKSLELSTSIVTTPAPVSTTFMKNITYEPTTTMGKVSSWIPEKEETFVETTTEKIWIASKNDSAVDLDKDQMEGKNQPSGFGYVSDLSLAEKVDIILYLNCFGFGLFLLCFCLIFIVKIKKICIFFSKKCRGKLRDRKSRKTEKGLIRDMLKKSETHSFVSRDFMLKMQREKESLRAEVELKQRLIDENKAQNMAFEGPDSGTMGKQMNLINSAADYNREQVHIL